MANAETTPEQNEVIGNGVAIVESEKEDDKDDDDVNKEETEIREMTVSSLITITFDEENYLSLKYKKDEFVLYRVSIYIGTESKTSLNLYKRYSDIFKFNQKLQYFHNRLCKFKNQLKQTLFLPKLPPKKQWQRNKLQKDFVSQRIRLLNVYVNEVTKYVTKSTQKIQDLYLNFFQINTSNSLYKYITNNDIEMLSQLYKYNKNQLIQFMDENKSNIFHYIISQNSIKSLQFILQNSGDNNNRELIIKLLTERDEYGITPLALSKNTNINDNNIYDSFLKQYDIDDNDSKDVDNDDMNMNMNINILPAQYRCNILQKKRKLWIIVNPFAGQGCGERIWQELVSKFLDFNADVIEYCTLITKQQFEAQKACAQLSLSDYNSYDGIVCIGGDGTIVEVLNGLYENNNFNIINLKNKCITPIAAGSGNGLAMELNMENILTALSKLLDGFETCIDAYLASQFNEKDTYSFVSTQWGTMSSIDLESESYRWIGSLRFALKGLSEVAWNTHYRARVYFKPIEPISIESDRNRIANNDEDWWQKLPNLYLDQAINEYDNNNNNVEHEEIPLNNAKNQDEEDEEEEEEKEEKPQYPNDWICIEAEFCLLCVTNLKCIGEGAIMGGNIDGFNAKTNALRLVWSEHTGRINYASALFALESGKHLDLEYVKYYDVEQVVIEPLIKGPPIDVDGERKPLKPVYVRLLPSNLVVTC